MTVRYLPKRTERNMTDAALRELCYLPDTFAWDQDTKATGFVDKKTGKQKYLRALTTGKPDIGGVKGIFGFVIELKKPGEKLKPHQSEWRDSYLAKTQGWYFVCRDVGEVYEAWKEVGCFCRCGQKISWDWNAEGLPVGVCFGCIASVLRCTCPPLPGRRNWRE